MRVVPVPSRRLTHFLTAMSAWLTTACSVESTCDGDIAQGGDGHNVIIIVSDDIGVDKTGAYGTPAAPARTPNIDALASRGMRFDNAYAHPTCSPSRASLLTGRQPSRHGIGRWIFAHGGIETLPLSEVTIPEMLRLSPHAYTSAAVGKWHVVGFDADSPRTHPLDQGFWCHAGSLGNPLESTTSGHTPRSYTRWEKAVDGEVEWSSRYMTSDTTDEALARIDNSPEPFFLYVNYNDAHEPLHVPPGRLRTGSVDGDDELSLYEAMAEAADTEIGRLLDGIPDQVLANTTVIYLSDNGTPGHGIVAPFDDGRGKGTIYELGVRVPLIVAGPLVSEGGTRSDALVHVVDLLPTVAELADVDLAELVFEEGDDAGQPVELDGVSLVPWIEDPSLPSPRQVVFTETFYPNGQGLLRSSHKRMVREADWKLVWVDDGGLREERLYDLAGAEQAPWDEGEDLLESGNPLTDDQADALARLSEAMQDQVAALP